MDIERSLAKELSGLLILIFGLCVAWLFWGPGFVYVSNGFATAQGAKANRRRFSCGIGPVPIKSSLSALLSSSQIQALRRAADEAGRVNLTGTAES